MTRAAAAGQPASVIEADLIWAGRRFERGLQLAINHEGRIAAVGDLGLRPTVRWPRAAILPGFVNAHSHAFQRGLRGCGERFPDTAGSFWTWRNEMYDLVRGLTPDRVGALSRRAFLEMRRSGITTVGEFHYLHHAGGEADFACDDAVRNAARAAGIRLVLLQTYYRTGGIGRPPDEVQRRFVSPDLSSYWIQWDRLAETLDPRFESLGVAAHSIRAVPLDDLVALQDESLRRGVVFHMHLEEQSQEIAEARNRLGDTPMALLVRHIPTARNVTAVHCTHTAPDDLESFLDAEGMVCLCPTTEANLGDGTPILDPILRRGARIALGTDSNARIDMLEEMRWAELAQRLSREARGVLRSTDGRVALRLLGAATLDGAAALGIDAGRIAPGAWADLAVFDLQHPSLAGCEDDTLLEALVFGNGAEVVLATAVGGEWTSHRSPHGHPAV